MANLFSEIVTKSELVLSNCFRKLQQFSISIMTQKRAYLAFRQFTVHIVI